MPRSDFDVASLAAYLHLTPQQIERLVSRGKLPGRKVAGQWRFAQAEIHHWMEQRIGVADDEELEDVEGALARSAASQGVSQPLLREWLRPETIVIPLEARTKTAVISAMVRIVADTGLLWDEGRMRDAVRSREDLHSTALDIGVAMLHPRRPQSTILAEPILALGITSSGIPFGGGRQLTDVFFLICSTDDRSHLQILARLSRLISNESVLEAIRNSSDSAAVMDVVENAEKEMAP